MEDAIELVDTCKELTNELYERWRAGLAEAQRLGKPPTARAPAPPTTLLRQLSTETQPVSTVWDDIGKLMIKGSKFSPRF